MWMITTTVLQLFVFVNVYCHALEKCGFFSSTLLLMSCLFACSGIETMCKINPVCHTSKLFHRLSVISTERKCEISCRKCSENAWKLISATRVQTQVVIKRAADACEGSRTAEIALNHAPKCFDPPIGLYRRADLSRTSAPDRDILQRARLMLLLGAHAKNTMTTREWARRGERGGRECGTVGSVEMGGEKEGGTEPAGLGSARGGRPTRRTMAPSRHAPSVNRQPFLFGQRLVHSSLSLDIHLFHSYRLSLSRPDASDATKNRFYRSRALTKSGQQLTGNLCVMTPGASQMCRGRGNSLHRRASVGRAAPRCRSHPVCRIGTEQPWFLYAQSRRRSEGRAAWWFGAVAYRRVGLFTPSLRCSCRALRAALSAASVASVSGRRASPEPRGTGGAPGVFVAHPEPARTG